MSKTLAKWNCTLSTVLAASKLCCQRWMWYCFSVYPPDVAISWVLLFLHLRMRLSFWTPLRFFNGFSEITFNIAETASVIYVLFGVFFLVWGCLFVGFWSFCFASFSQKNMGKFHLFPQNLTHLIRTLTQFLCAIILLKSIILSSLLKLGCSLEKEWCALFFNPLHVIYYSLSFLYNNRLLLSLFPKTDDKFVDAVVARFSN